MLEPTGRGVFRPPNIPPIPPNVPDMPGFHMIESFGAGGLAGVGVGVGVVGAACRGGDESKGAGFASGFGAGAAAGAGLCVLHPERISAPAITIKQCRIETLPIRD